MTILEHVAESQVDSWRGLTDSRRPRARRIQLSEQSAPVPFLTAPRTSIPPARSDEDHWLVDVTDEMRSYLTLVPDWDSYGGGPVRKRIADAALRIAEVLARTGFSRPDICPQSSGGVLLEWQQTGRVLTVDLDGVEGFSFAYESPGVESEGGIEDFVSLLRAGLQPF